MPNIKPISDLRNYTEVLKEAQEGAPVFLTKNGRGEYVILDMKEYDKMRATIALMSKLEEGEQSARKEGWASADEVEASLGILRWNYIIRQKQEMICFRSRNQS